MTDEVVLLPLHLLEAFSDAMKGGRGELDAWLEVNDEADVRIHVEAYTRAKVSRAIAAKDAEVEALRAEVAEWKRVAAAQAELHGDAEACAERLAEALQNIRNVAREPYGTLNAARVGTTADAALNTTAAQENDDA